MGFVNFDTSLVYNPTDISSMISSAVKFNPDAINNIINSINSTTFESLLKTPIYSAPGTPQFSSQSYSIPQIDATALQTQLQSQVKTVMDGLQSLGQQQADMIKKIEQEQRKNVESFASSLAKTVENIKTITTGTTIQTTEIEKIQENLDKLASIATGAPIETGIQQISNIGRDTIYDITKNLNTLINLIDNTASTIKNTRVDTDEKKQVISDLLTQLENNKKIVTTAGTEMMEKIKEITNQNIGNLQTISNNIRTTTEETKKLVSTSMKVDEEKPIELKWKGYVKLPEKKLFDDDTLYIKKSSWEGSDIKAIHEDNIKRASGDWTLSVATFVKGSVLNELAKTNKIDPNNWADAEGTAYGSGTYRITELTADKVPILHQVKSAGTIGGEDIGKYMWTDPTTKKITFDVSTEKGKQLAIEAGALKEPTKVDEIETNAILSKYYIPNQITLTETTMKQPNESINDWVARLSKTFDTTGKIVRIDGKEELAKDKDLTGGVWTWLQNEYWGGKDANEVLIKNGYGVKAYKDVGKRTYTEDMNLLEILANGIGEIQNKLNGFDSSRIIVEQYIPDQNATKQLKAAVMSGTSAPGLTDYYTRYAFYLGGSSEDLAEWAKTEKGAGQLAIDLTNPELKNILTDKLNKDTMKIVNEQYQKPEIARNVVYVPGYEITKAIETIANPYITGNPLVDATIAVATGGVAGELGALPKGMKTLTTSALKDAVKYVPDTLKDVTKITDLTDSIKNSAATLSVLMVPGIGDTTKLADTLKTSSNIFEVTKDNKIVNFATPPNMAKFENDIFNAASDPYSQAEALKKIIQEHETDQAGITAKLGTIKLTDPTSFEQMKNITPTRNISQVEINVAKEIFDEASKKIDDTTRKFAEDVLKAYEKGTSPVEDVLKIREKIGEIPTENLINKAFTIDNGKYMESTYKLMEDLRQATKSAFEPLMSVLDETKTPVMETFEVPEWRTRDYLPIIKNMDGMDKLTYKTITDIITLTGTEDKSLESTIAILEKLSPARLEEMVKEIPTLSVNDIRETEELLKEIRTKKLELLSGIRPIPKVASTSLLPTISEKVVRIDNVNTVQKVLDKNNINTVSDFTKLTKTQLKNIADKEKIDSKILTDAQRKLKKYINYEADPTKEEELLSVLTGKQIVKKTTPEEEITQLYKKWETDTDKETGITFNTETGKWSIKNTTRMKPETFDEFLDSIPLSTLRDMNIGDFGKLATDEEEDMIRREMLYVAQEQASSGVAIAKQTVPEMSITGKSFGLEEPGTIYLEQTKQGIRTGSDIRRTAKYRIEGREVIEMRKSTPTSEIDSKLADEVMKRNAIRKELGVDEMTDKEINELREQLIAESKQKEQILTEMKIADEDIEKIQGTAETKLISEKWTRPISISDNVDEARKIATEAKEAAIYRATSETINDAESALKGDIAAVNRIYERDPVLGEMVETYIAASAKAENKMPETAIRSAMNALQNGRDISAAQILKQLGEKGDLTRYVNIGLFDNISMKDISRLKNELGETRTKTLLNAKDDAALAVIKNTNKSAAFKIMEDMELTLDELRAITKDDNILRNAIDATNNPLGRNRNILNEYKNALKRERDELIRKVDADEIELDEAKKINDGIIQEAKEIMRKNKIAEELVC